MAQNLGYMAGAATTAFAMPDYYVWDSSVILVDGTYHMFASRWPKSMGFGNNWLFHSEIVHATPPPPKDPTSSKTWYSPAGDGHTLTA